MSLKHVIVQAGGKGTRMGHLTEHKPKALVSVNGMPMLYSLSRAFGGCDFYVIADYKADVLETYMESLPPEFKYELIRPGGKGTCAGIRAAAAMIPSDDQVAVVWCDLYFESPPPIPDANADYIGLTDKLKCRWCFRNGEPLEEPSTAGGILGLFFFKSKEILSNMPDSGEFVRFLKETGAKLNPIMIDRVAEIGNIEAYEKIRKRALPARFFNSVRIDGETVIKEVLDKNFEHLLADEINWYEFVIAHGYKNIPKVYSFKQPLVLEKINGSSPHNLENLDDMQKEGILTSILSALDDLHGIGAIPSSQETLNKVYIDKTIERIKKIKPLIPHSDSEHYVVNGKRVRNLLNQKHAGAIEALVRRMKPPEKFTVIHGDPTFSNMLIDHKTNKVFLIDPRGYFGSMRIYGDQLYDYAKLYYSVVGNYDTFNEKDFRVHMEGGKVTVSLRSEGWEGLERLFESRFAGRMKDIKDPARAHMDLAVRVCGGRYRLGAWRIFPRIGAL